MSRRPENDLVEAVMVEILRDAHQYAGGLEPHRATLGRSQDRSWRKPLSRGRDRVRDVVERTAARAGFSHRHFDPALGAERLRSILTMSDGLQRTYDQLADEKSRRALVDLLKLRVLGPYHAPLPITPERFRSEQERVERTLRVQEATFEVSDPWFSPLSLYRVPVNGAEPVTLHDHSVDIVSVFVLGQYQYASGSAQVRVEPGDTVLDIGGCWGDTALYFASHVGPQGKVYTFEFDPENLEILRTNLALNPGLADRVEIVERALWDSSGEKLQFSQAGRCTTVGVDPSNTATSQVETITVDDFVSAAGIDRVAFIKMDVEGAEPHVLRGAGQTLASDAPKLAVAAYHQDDDLVELPRQIETARSDYRLYLGTFSPVEEETVLFAEATSRSSSM